jgi:carotenoid cleavage dioxygenase-like enzyme
MDGSTHPQNPYLAGNFAPVRSEDDFALTVTGKIPDGLNGALYRNGPNPQFEPRGTYHWFGGDGMIHGFFIEDGQARYRNRWVQTPRWTEEHAAGQALFGSMGAPSDPSVAGHDSGVANTNIVHHAGRLMALEEAHAPFELDAQTLAPKGYMDTGGRFTAHPKMDPETGEMVWFAYSAGASPLNDQIDYGVTDAAGKITRRDRFTAPYSSMIHDFLVTRNHVLFPVLPLTGDMGRAMKGGPAFAWEPEKGAFVGVMHRQAAVETIRWFELPPCYVFHPMNAWEEGSLIHAEVMEYPRAPLFPNADGSDGEDAPAVLVRWTFDLAAASNAVKRTVLDDMAGEFPRFDERRTGLPYRHGWFASVAGGDNSLAGFDSLSHIDLTTGRRTTLLLPAGDNASEAVFVPRSRDAAEGDGWLLAPIYRGATDTSDLIILDAQDILAGPVATVHMPRRVPFGFHGNWVGA